jgi:hypothetical protein
VDFGKARNLVRDQEVGDPNWPMLYLESEWKDQQIRIVAGRRQRRSCLIADTRNIPEDFRDNLGTSEKWELSGFRGVSDTNEAI